MPLKLTDEQVITIRRQAAEGTARRDLAIRFDVSLETVCRIIRGDSRRSPKPKGTPEFAGELSDAELKASERRLAALQAEVGSRPAKPAAVTTDVPLSDTMAWLLDK
jgi:hypothetical protein